MKTLTATKTAATSKAFALSTDGGVRVVAPNSPLEADEVLFGTEKALGEIVGAGMKRLVEIFNLFPGVTPTKRFMNRPAALRRVFVACEALAADTTAAVPEIAVPVPAAAPELILSRTGGRIDLDEGVFVVYLDADSGTVSYRSDTEGDATAFLNKKAPVVSAEDALKIVQANDKKGKAPKAAKAPKAETPKVVMPKPAKSETSGKRVSVLGHPVTQVIAYMGAHGVKFDGASKALIALGAAETPASTIRTFLTKGKAGTKPAAPLTAAQAAQLTKLAA